MHYKILLPIAGILMFLLSCNTREISPAVQSPVETLLDFRKGRSPKSYTRILDTVSKSDSIVRLEYTVFYNEDTFKNEYEFPLKTKRHEYISPGGGSISVNLVDSFRCPSDGMNTTIFKYFWNEINSVDEELIIYYIEGLGIFRMESAAWGTHRQMVQSQELPLKDLFYFHEMIHTDLEPFDMFGPYYRLPPPPPPPSADES